jgi:hypothetical protein
MQRRAQRQGQGQAEGGRGAGGLGGREGMKRVCERVFFRGRLRARARRPHLHRPMKTLRHATRARHRPPASCQTPSHMLEGCLHTCTVRDSIRKPSVAPGRDGGSSAENHRPGPTHALPRTKQHTCSIGRAAATIRVRAPPATEPVGRAGTARGAWARVMRAAGMVLLCGRAGGCVRAGFWRRMLELRSERRNHSSDGERKQKTPQTRRENGRFRSSAPPTALDKNPQNEKKNEFTLHTQFFDERGGAHSTRRKHTHAHQPTPTFSLPHSLSSLQRTLSARGGGHRRK